MRASSRSTSVRCGVPTCSCTRERPRSSRGSRSLYARPRPASFGFTWEIVSRLARELDHVSAVRVAHAARSHDLVLPYVGTDTWVLSPDGDEIFDPEGLRRLRAELEAGVYDEWFRLFPAMLHCVELDAAELTATGYLAPPARSGPKLFNFAALRSWDRVYRE